ncbi:MAG: hypothetical protein QOH36_1691 [Actinomycetota bacterium]|nr:hypothetical protein [Actinomycetota bacterium]
MATSPSEPSDPVPPEVIAIAVALAATMFEPVADETAGARPPDVAPWRWDAWDD